MAHAAACSVACCISSRACLALARASLASFDSSPARSRSSSRSRCSSACGTPTHITHTLHKAHTARWAGLERSGEAPRAVPMLAVRAPCHCVALRRVYETAGHSFMMQAASKDYTSTSTGAEAQGALCQVVGLGRTRCRQPGLAQGGPSPCPVCRAGRQALALNVCAKKPIPGPSSRQVLEAPKRIARSYLRTLRVRGVGPGRRWAASHRGRCRARCVACCAARLPPPAPCAAPPAGTRTRTRTRRARI